MSNWETVFKMDMQKSQTEIVRVSIKTFEHQEYIDFRIFYYADENELRPTKRGFTLPFKKTDQLYEALEQANSFVNKGNENNVH